MSNSQGVTPSAMANAAPSAASRAPTSDIFMKKRQRFARGPPQASAQRSSAPAPPQANDRSDTHAQNNIDTEAAAPPKLPYKDFPIVISKADSGRGMKFHGIKFQSKPSKDGVISLINPYDESQFSRPIRLHRRYARDSKQLPEEQNGVDDKEKEIFNARRAERQAEREANQALIAPGAKKSQLRRKKNQKNVEDVYYDENNPKQQKAAQLRYEETKPWHLEDFDGKNIWIGAYQEPLSECCVLFDAMKDGNFALIPVERWYNFRQTDKISAMNSEEVEKHMSKKYVPGRWFLKAKDEEEARPVQRKRQTEDVKPSNEEYRKDLDELDYEEKEDFQDDDEGLIFGDDDEAAKEVEQKVREQMREANLPATNMKSERDWDEEEDKERQEEKAERKMTKKLRKRMIKHERKYEYDSNSDHPYSESSDDDSEEERRLEEERVAASQKSGASTQGNNTPAGRVEKRLKRPGSPGLSEASGNESRKKIKLNGRAMSSGLLPEGARSPLSRSMAGYGSGSETDASRIRSRRVSPHEGSQPGSRAQSPGRGTPPPPRLPTIDEIRAAIPPEGISIKQLGAMFKTRVSKEKTGEFIAMIKANTIQDPVSKLLKSAV